MALMAYILVIAVCVLASVLGPVCGIGGGVIIKPVIDALGIMTVAQASFLSSMSVLTMALATLAQNAMAHTSTVNVRAMAPLALGSAVGGVAGKILFGLLERAWDASELIGAVQACVLIGLSAVVFAYTLGRARMRSLTVRSGWASAVIGCIAGACWSFLGIGGGPFNLAILGFFFSMESKPAAQASLFIIACSQLAGLAYSLMASAVPDVAPNLLLGGCVAACAGSVIGRRAASRMDSAMVDRLYLWALAAIICISLYNAVRFIGLI